MKQLMMAVTMAGALVCAAADQTLTYTAADKPATLGTGGELAFTYETGEGFTNVTKIVANIAKGDTIYLKGDKLAFGTDATIETAGLGDLVISNALTGTSGLLVTNTSSAQLTMEWWGDALLHNANWTTVFENVDLDDIEIVSSDEKTYRDRSRDERIWDPAGPGLSNPQKMYPFWVKREMVDGVKMMTFQLQCYADAVKYVKVELKQDGANIAARISDAGYILPTETFNADYLKNMVYRDDMNAMRARWMSDQDPNVNPRFYNQTIKLPSSTGGGYGVGQLTIRRTDLPSVNFANSARAPALGGTLKITANARARRMGIGAFSDANTTLDINGIWETGDSNSGQSTQIKGTGGTLAIVGETLGHENPCDSYFPNFVTTTASSVDNTKSLAKAVGLQHTFFELTNLPPCYIWGPQMMPLKDAPNSIATPLHWRFYTNDVRSAYATVQMQGSNSVSMIRCVILKFQQSTYDLNVSIVTNLGCFTPGNGGNGYYGMDFENLEGFTGVYGYKKNTNATVPSPFSISNLVCQFSRPGEYLVTINASNQMSNARLVVAGKPDGTRIKANMNYTSRFPKNGEVEIRDGGTVVISVGSDGPNATWQNGTASIKVLSGGILRTYGNVQDATSNTNNHTGKWALKRGQRMDLLGGEFFPAWLHSTSAQHCFCYLNNLTLADGARVECDIPFWVGNAGSTEAYNWRVRGTSPSTIDSPVQFLGTGTTGWFEFKIDVADVAEGTDFFMTKPITRYSSTSLSNIRIGKFGQGTMEIQDTIDVIKGVYIYGGAFKLAGSHLTDASAQKFALSGGTLEAADGTENSCGPLAITARGGKIKLGAGATLTFADSSAETWPTEKVVVEGFVEGAIRFGSSNRAVPRVRRIFRTDGGALLRVREDGYLTANIPGTNIAIR